MKRLRRIVILLLIICLIPVPRYAKDGGTFRLDAILYTYIHWHILDEEVYDKYRDTFPYSKYYKNGYWDRRKLVLFPKNYGNIEFFE